MIRADFRFFRDARTPPSFFMVMTIDTTSLPQDLAACHGMIRSLAEEVESQARLNEQLEHRIQLLLRRYYGPRAERYDPKQLLLMANEALAPAAVEETEETEEPRSPPRRRRRRKGRREAWAALPRKRVEHPVAPEERICFDCGKEKAKIGEDVSEEIEYNPASLFVIEHVKPKFACRDCENGVTTAPTPPRPIEKGVPGPGMLAHVAVSKFLTIPRTQYPNCA